MTADLPLLSVRGEALRFVDPDVGELTASVDLVRETARDAVEAVATAVESVRRHLTTLGGSKLEASTRSEPLTWSIRRITSSPEWDHAQGGRTGRTEASASVTIRLREVGLLAPVEDLATSVPGFAFSSASWGVDPDNEEWRTVRQEAVQEAMRRARDYADALGTTLVAVEEVADVGLLTDQPSPRMYAAHASTLDSSSEATLDPVPQQLRAVVEARFRMAAIVVAT